MAALVLMSDTGGGH